MTFRDPSATNGGCIGLKPDVVLVLGDERARLLDFNRGRFFALDPIGTRMLVGVREHGTCVGLRRLAQEFGVEEKRVVDDWHRLAQDLEGKQLIIRQSPVDPVTRRIPGRLGLFLMLTWAWICIRLFGWAGTIGLWRRWRRHQPRPDSVTNTGEAVAALNLHLQRVTAWHPLNTQCKERALVAWQLLHQRFNLPAELVVGVILFPFQAHAWVECGPWTVTDERNKCDEYTPVARYA